MNTIHKKASTTLPKTHDQKLKEKSFARANYFPPLLIHLAPTISGGLDNVQEGDGGGLFGAS